jgi:hypothetical protein
MSQRIADDPAKVHGHLTPCARDGPYPLGLFRVEPPARLASSSGTDALQGRYLRNYANALGKGEFALAYPYVCDEGLCGGAQGRRRDAKPLSFSLAERWPLRRRHREKLSREGSLSLASTCCDLVVSVHANAKKRATHAVALASGETGLW